MKIIASTTILLASGAFATELFNNVVPSGLGDAAKYPAVAASRADSFNAQVDAALSHKSRADLTTAFDRDATDLVGNTFKLHQERPLKKGLSPGISGVFKDTASCISERDASGDAGHYSLTTSNTTEEHIKSRSFELGVKGGGPVGAFMLSGSLDIGWSKTNTQTLDAFRMTLDSYILNKHVEFTDSQECRNQDNLDDHFLEELSALPVGDRFDPTTETSWFSYNTFLNEFGSHLLVQATTGARFIREVETTDQSDKTIETLKVKLCLEAEQAGAAVLKAVNKTGATKIEACIGGGKNSSDYVHTFDAKYDNYVLGGSPDSSVKTGISTSNKMPSAHDLNEFMSEASSGNGPVKFKFEPIWETLFEVYNTPCLRSKTPRAQDDENCRMLQRAKTLQAHYEGRLAYKCTTKLTPGFGTIQKMVYAEELGEHLGADLATGVKPFACWNHKTGCYDDNDCHAHWNWGRKTCYMYGQNAIYTEEIPFSDKLRDVVIGDKDQAAEWPDKGGNNFCSWSMKSNGHWGCLCRTERDWHIDNISVQRDRGIYVQSSASSIMEKKRGKTNLRAGVSVA